MVLLILLQLFFLFFLLVVNGEPLGALLLRRLKLFSDLDFVQICLFDVYLGGFILYVIALLPFRLFGWIVVFCFALLSFLLSVIIHFKALTSLTSFSKIRVFLTENRKKLFDYAAVFGMFTIFLLINLLSLSGFVFGSVRDESIHSLDVQVILENNFVPATLQPYLAEGIIYPQASHVVFAFAFYMLNMDVPKVVFYASVLFKSLSVLGAYFLGKKLGVRRAYSLGLSFVFTFMSSWPLSIVWGGNPFLFGFPLFLVCLGLLFSLFCFPTRNSFAELIIVGLLLGYVGATVISFLQTLIMIAFLVFVYYLVRKHNQMYRTLLKFVIIFGVSLLPLSLFLFRFFAFYQYPGHNIGLPSDFTGWAQQQLYITQALQWAFENLSPYVLLRVLIILLLVSFIVLLWKTKDYKDVKSIVAFALAIFLAATLLSFIAFFLPADFGITSWGHQGIILSVSINILIIAFYVILAKFCDECKIRRLPKIFHKDSTATILLTITLLSLTVVPFIYYRLLVDPEVLRGAYGMFAVTTQSDYDLMIWMRENLSDAVVLVHPYEAGLFIPSVSHHRIVFPYSGSSLSSSYQTLVGLLQNNTLNTTAYELMRHWNISHVFVGANVIYWMFGNPKWNAKLFLGNPNFKLVKNFGDAYLFELEKYVNPDIVFLDGFEYEIWEQNGWANNFVGNGVGDVNITTSFGCNGSRCLRITAQAVPTIREWELKFAYWVGREIFVSNNSEVTFSFYLNATEGFHRKDTFAVLISNIHRNQSLVITTPDGVYDEYANAIRLNGRSGPFSFNLSREWQQVFNSPLPHSFILEFVNYDFDGVENVAYIDNVKVTSTPLG